LGDDDKKDKAKDTVPMEIDENKSGSSSEDEEDDERGED
jgi:hypothetical protein